MPVRQHPLRGKGRPVTPVLSRTIITRTALELLCSVGLQGLSMRKLALELEASPSALYNHVSSKVELLAWIQDFVYESIDSSSFHHEDWDVALLKWAQSYRDVFSRYPELVPVVATLPVSGAARTLRMYEDVSVGLMRAGCPKESVVDTIVAFESFILGAAMDATAPEGIFDVGDLITFAPNFSAAVACRTNSMAGTAAFLLGLQSLVAGLRLTLGPRMGVADPD